MPFYTQSPINQQAQNKRRLSLTICLLLLAGALGVLGFQFWKLSKEVKEDFNPLKLFRLPTNPQPSDMTAVLESMRFNPEFEFYFTIADPETVSAINSQALSLIKEHSNAQSLLAEIQSRKAGVERLAGLLNFVQYREEFLADPSIAPDLNQTIHQYFFDNFLLTVLGICYKANYDPHFEFYWDPITIQATDKVKEVLIRWKKDH